MVNEMENIKVDQEISETEQAGLFYKMLARRPLIDVIPEEGEGAFWEKNFNNSNELTLYSWRNDWVNNTKENIKHFGYFDREHSVKVFANELINKPVVLLGAGPSLEKNIKYLKNAKEMGVTIMASHHTLMYLADQDIKPDFVCCLDAGKQWTSYWGDGKIDCKNIPLLTEQNSNHEQLKAYPGPVYFYRSTLPDKSVVGKFVEMELKRLVDWGKQGSQIEVGGHILGAMLSLARGVMMADTLIFAGCDYCFTPQGKFYPWDYQIDKTVMMENTDGTVEEKPAPPPAEGMIYDIFGNSVPTNGAYLGFKNVMDAGIKLNAINALKQNNSLEFINASEGGALGALKGGNSKWIKYLRLEDALIYAKAKRDLKK